MPAVRFVIRNYVRNGLTVTFDLAAVDANGAVDSSYAGTVNFTSTNSTIPGLPASFTFVPGNAGVRSFSTTIQTIENVQIFAADAAATLATAGIYIGGTGPDTFTAGAGGDVIDPNGGTNNPLIGNAGEDIFYLAGGISTIAGGSGVDRLIFDLRGNSFGLSNQPGVPIQADPAGGMQGAYTNGQNASVNFTGIEHITILTDNNSSDNITTGDGEDEFSQVALDSSTYIRDTANLGGGIDRLSVDARATNGVLSFLGLNYDGSGEVGLYGNGKLGFTNVERFFLQGGNAGDDLRGLDYGDRFDGNAGNDRLAGRGGDDDLRGGAGADVIDGDGRVTILLAADNQNNAGTGASDNDFRVTGNYNLANPAEFDLVVGTQSVGTARLRIRATDVENASAGFDPEVDEVYVNDVLIGTLAQFADNMTGDTVLTFDAALLASGIARIRIQNINATQDYSFRIDDVELTLEKTGNDRLDGGAGVDQLVGGRGDDVYVVDEDRDQVQEQAAQGTDRVLSQSRSFTLGAGIENLTAALPATPVALTAESQINSDIVAATQHPRSVTVLNDGGYVVTWQDVNNGTDARARVFNGDGSARSAEFTVNASTAGSQGQFGLASVALANGGFLVAYYDTNSGPNGERILGRVFDANGVAQGADYTLTDTAGTFDSFPAMARLDDGRIALFSQNGGSQDGNGTFGIRYTLLNADGSASATPSGILQTTTAGDQLGPSVARLDDGRLIVIWESGEPGGKVFRGRFIGVDGVPSGNDFQISALGGEAPDSGEVRAQVTAINGGGFAVAWGITNEIQGRVFDSAGLPVGPQFILNQRTDSAQTTVAITRLVEGGFMAAWTSDNGQDGDIHGIVARLFNADGSPRGDDFVVNQIGTRFQLFPELATLQDGRIVAVFSSDIPGSGSNYEGRQVILDTTPDQTLVGNELANSITGGMADDILAGSGGGDTLNGGAGNDLIFGGGFVGSGTNLIVNGGFETQDGSNVTRDFILAAADGIGEGIAFRGVTSLFGWTRGNTSAFIELETNSSSSLFATGDGTAVVNLEYGGNQQQSLSQDIAGLTAGQPYLLRFAAAQLASASDFTESMQILWNGVVVTTIAADTKTPGFYVVVLEAAATGTGTSGANRLEFREISSGDGGGTTLDAISLEALVPAADMTVGALGPNLITNGSFEQRDATTTARDFTVANGNTNFNGGEPLYAFSNQLLGWSFLPGTGRVEFNIDNPTNPGNLFQTSDGLVGLDMDVAGNEPVGIFQDVTGLAAGERYRITVSAALPVGPNNNADQSAALQVIWNGRVVGTITPTSLTPVDYSFDVYAQANGAGAAGANRLALQEVGSEGGQGRGTLLDNVRLNLVTAAAPDNDTLNGGVGSDTLYGAGGDDILNGGDGVDRLFGGDGVDQLDGGAGADALAGGAGNDVYLIDGSGDTITEASNEGTADEVRTALANYTLPDNVEILTYLGAGAVSFRGNAANNMITGTVNDDVINLGNGGDDTASGGDGNDGFYFGGAYTAADTVDGGAGSRDQIGLQGDYSAGLTLTPSSSTGIEQFVLLPGSDTRFGAPGTGTSLFNIITGDAAIAAGQQMVFQANQLRVGENFTLDASGELDGSVFTYGGLGNDLLTGGQMADAFYFGSGRFGAGDIVDGQGGLDQMALQGTYAGANAVTFSAGQLLNLEMLILFGNNDTRFGGAGSGTAYSYDVTMNNGNVLAGGTLIIQANNLEADESLTFNGSAELDGAFTIYSGNGADVIVGSAGADMISGRGGADTLTGGAGTDTLLYTNLTDSITSAQDHILDFAVGDIIDLSRLDVPADPNGANAFSFIGAAAFSNVAGQLRATNTAGSDWLIEGDVDGDGVADISIRVTTSDADPITAADFLL